MDVSNVIFFLLEQEMGFGARFLRRVMPSRNGYDTRAYAEAYRFVVSYCASLADQGDLFFLVQDDKTGREVWGMEDDASGVISIQTSYADPAIVMLAAALGDRTLADDVEGTAQYMSRPFSKYRKMDFHDYVRDIRTRGEELMALHSVSVEAWTRNLMHGERSVAVVTRDSDLQVLSDIAGATIHGPGSKVLNELSRAWRGRIGTSQGSSIASFEGKSVSMDYRFAKNVDVVLKPEEIVVHHANGGAVVINLLAVPPNKDGGFLIVEDRRTATIEQMELEGKIWQQINDDEDFLGGLRERYPDSDLVKEAEDKLKGLRSGLSSPAYLTGPAKFVFIKPEGGYAKAYLEDIPDGELSGRRLTLWVARVSGVEAGSRVAGFTGNAGWVSSFFSNASAEGIFAALVIGEPAVFTVTSMDEGGASAAKAVQLSPSQTEVRFEMVPTSVGHALRRARNGGGNGRRKTSDDELVGTPIVVEEEPEAPATTVKVAVDGDGYIADSESADG